MAGLIVETTKRILAERGPHILRSLYWESHVPKGQKPDFKPRLQAAAGPHKTGDDPHIAGRALDIILFASRPWERKTADDLVQAFLSIKDKLNFISVIYNGSEWNGSGQQFPHPGHETHIHIEWATAMMNHVGFEGALSDAVKLKISNRWSAVRRRP